MKELIEVETKSAAWEKAASLFPFDYERNEFASRNAGYPIFSATDKSNGSFICDLGCRLELNIRNNDGTEAETINIWIEDRRYTAAEVRKIVKKQLAELKAIEALKRAAEANPSDAAEEVQKVLVTLELVVREDLQRFGL